MHKNANPNCKIKPKAMTVGQAAASAARAKTYVKKRPKARDRNGGDGVYPEDGGA